jgi:hypothetical protein
MSFRREPVSRAFLRQVFHDAESLREDIHASEPASVNSASASGPLWDVRSSISPRRRETSLSSEAPPRSRRETFQVPPPGSGGIASGRRLARRRWPSVETSNRAYRRRAPAQILREVRSIPWPASWICREHDLKGFPGGEPSGDAQSQVSPDERPEQRVGSTRVNGRTSVDVPRHSIGHALASARSRVGLAPVIRSPSRRDGGLLSHAEKERPTSQSRRRRRYPRTGRRSESGKGTAFARVRPGKGSQQTHPSLERRVAQGAELFRGENV